MAKRDVDLVIRAKDQALKVIEGIAGALDQLQASQDGVSKSAERADGLLGQLGDQFKTLQASLQGLKGLAQIASQIERASAAVTRIESQFERASDQSRELKTRTEEAAATLARLGEAARSAEASFKGQVDSLAESRRELAAQNDRIKLLVARYRELREEIPKGTQANEQQLAQFRQLDGQMAQATARRQALVEVIERGVAATTREKAQLQAANIALREASAHHRNLAVASEENAASLKEMAEELERAKRELADIQSVADRASRALGGVEARNEAVAEASRRAAEDLQRVAEAIKRAQATTTQPQAVTPVTDRRSALAALNAEAQKLRELDEARKASIATVGRLSAELKAAVQPSQQLETALLLARNAARESTAAFEQQKRVALDMANGIKAAKAVAAGFAPVFHQLAAEQAQAAATAQLAGNAFQGFLRRLLGIKEEANADAAALDRLDGAARRAAAGVGTWGEHTRRALSLGQRLRGEVLALAASYVGLFNAINQAGSVVTAFRTLEAATSRLGVVFQQDVGRVKNELRFIADNADRLGLSFAVLADEYSKFAVAADAANFPLEDQRRLFLAIAESARVNKVSLENLQGIYLAFTQILSKGKVASEELRRQLGDRMAGAFNLFAEAIGVTAAELDDMLRKGEVIADRDTLIKFAERLEKGFGPQLASALQTTTTQLDRFNNNIFQSQLLIAKGGFIEALTDVVKQLNKQFESAEGKQFFLGVGAALGNVVRLLGVFVLNLDKIILAAKVAAAIVIARFLVETATRLSKVNNLSSETIVRINTMTRSWKDFGKAIDISNVFRLVSTFAQTVRQMDVFNQKLTVNIALQRLSATTLGVMRVGLTALATAARAAWIAIGGFPGAILTLATFAITELFLAITTGAPPATKVLEEHERQLQDLREAYQDAKRAGKEFNAELAKTTALEAIRSFDDLTKQVAKARQEFDDFIVDASSGISAKPQDRGLVEQLKILSFQLIDGSISAGKFRQDISKIFEDNDDQALRDFIVKLDEQAKKIEMVEVAQGESAAALKLLRPEYEGLNEILDRTGVSMSVVTGEIDEAAGAMREGAKDANAYAEALKRLTPEETDADRVVREINEVNKAFDVAVKNAQTLSPGLAGFLEASRRTTIQQIKDSSDASKELLRREKELADEAERRRKAIADAKKDLQFEIAQSQRSKREQAVAEALNDQSFSPADIDKNKDAAEIARLAGKKFDLEVEKRSQKAIADVEAKIREARDIPLERDQFVQLELAKLELNDASEEQLQKLREQLGLLFDVEQQQRRLKELLEQARQLDQDRIALSRELKEAIASGDPEAAGLQQELARVTAELEKAKSEALDFAILLGDDKAITQLGRIGAKVTEVKSAIIDAREVNRDLARVFGDSAVESGKLIGQWLDGTRKFGEGLSDLRDSFLQFVADFLLGLSRMIAQQLILNAISGQGNGGGVGGFLANIFNRRDEKTGDAEAPASKAVASLGKAAEGAAVSVGQDLAQGAAEAALKTGIEAGASASQTATTITLTQALVALQTAAAAAAAALSSLATQNVVAAVAHSGGVIGRVGLKRQIAPAWFSNAIRYHSGGIAGLAPGEVPAILRRGEEVLTEDDPRHLFNGAGAQPAGQTALKIINAFDAGDMLSQALSTQVGEKAFLNFVRKNPGAVRRAME